MINREVIKKINEIFEAFFVCIDVLDVFKVWRDNFYSSFLVYILYAEAYIVLSVCHSATPKQMKEAFFKILKDPLLYT